MSALGGDRLLALLSITILVLFAAALLLAGLVFVLHFRNERRDALRARLDREWEPALLEVLSGARSSDAFPIPVAHAQQLHLVNFLGRYARRLRGAERRTVMALAEPLLPRVAARLNDRSAEVRARAVQTLASLGLPGYAPQVIGALDDPSYLVAMRAAHGLARREHPEFAVEVLARLERFQLWNPRFVAAMLAGMGPAAAPGLRASLADPAEAPRARAVAAGALTTLRHLEAGPHAADALAQTQDPDLQQAALQLLGTVGRAAHVPVVSGFATHPVPFVRAAALEALVRIGGPAELAQVEAALEDESPWVALTAGQALAGARRLDLLDRAATGVGQASVVAQEVLSESRP
ncbi:MAG TPA: HEAT repeat domain-containing protein [Longimicrobiales bacterium]|nr:HEAT repeat domain-containing protein [Longimicrobiales bacterium]